MTPIPKGVLLTGEPCAPLVSSSVLLSQFRGIWRLWHVVADLIRAEIRSARLFMNLRIELSAKLLMAVVLG